MFGWSNMNRQYFHPFAIYNQNGSETCSKNSFARHKNRYCGASRDASKYYYHYDNNKRHIPSCCFAPIFPPQYGLALLRTPTRAFNNNKSHIVQLLSFTLFRLSVISRLQHIHSSIKLGTIFSARLNHHSSLALSPFHGNLDWKLPQSFYDCHQHQQNTAGGKAYSLSSCLMMMIVRWFWRLPPNPLTAHSQCPFVRLSSTDAREMWVYIVKWNGAHSPFLDYSIDRMFFANTITRDNTQRSRNILSFSSS